MVKAPGGRNHQGFTLVELLVALTVIGLIAGIAAFSLSGLTSRAQVRACLTDVKAVELAMSGFFSDYVAPPSSPNWSLTSSTGTLVSGGYLSALADTNSLPYELKLVDVVVSESPSYSIRILKRGSGSLVGTWTSASIGTPENLCKATLN